MNEYITTKIWNLTGIKYTPETLLARLMVVEGLTKQEINLLNKLKIRYGKCKNSNTTHWLDIYCDWWNSNIDSQFNEVSLIDVKNKYAVYSKTHHEQSVYANIGNYNLPSREELRFIRLASIIRNIKRKIEWNGKDIQYWLNNWKSGYYYANLELSGKRYGLNKNEYISRKMCNIIKNDFNVKFKSNSLVYTVIELSKS